MRRQAHLLPLNTAAVRVEVVLTYPQMDWVAHHCMAVRAVGTVAVLLLHPALSQARQVVHILSPQAGAVLLALTVLHRQMVQRVSPARSRMAAQVAVAVVLPSQPRPQARLGVLVDQAVVVVAAVEQGRRAVRQAGRADSAVLEQST